jgi:copper chaperone
MITETLNVANMKCSGCAHSITTKLGEINGLSSSEVNIDEGTIAVHYEMPEVQAVILTKLSSMGYPEATAENGLLMQAKSYANCMIGKSSVLFAGAKHSD